MICVSHLQRQSHSITCNPGLPSYIVRCGSHLCTSWICSFIRQFAYPSQRKFVCLCVRQLFQFTFSSVPCPSYDLLSQSFPYLHQNKCSHFSKQQLTKSNPPKKKLRIFMNLLLSCLFLPPKKTSPVFSQFKTKSFHSRFCHRMDDYHDDLDPGTQTVGSIPGPSRF